MLLSTLLASCDFPPLLSGSVGVAQKQLVLPAQNNVFSRDLALELFALDQCSLKEQTAASFSEYGFKVIAQDYYDLDLNDHSNTSGYTFGKGKVIVGNTEKDAYLLQIRPTSDHEWYSNVDIMRSDEQEQDYKKKDREAEISGIGRFVNFEETAALILDTVSEYVHKNDILIISGYSRGAGVANILCEEIVHDLRVKPKFYVYTFGCPYVYSASTASMKDTIKSNYASDFKGVFNVLTPGDIFSNLPIYKDPATCLRYGTDVLLGDKDAYSDDVAALSDLLKNFYFKGSGWEKSQNFLYSYYYRDLNDYIEASLLDEYVSISHNEQGQMVKQWIQDVFASDALLQRKNIDRFKYYGKPDNLRTYELVLDLMEQLTNSGNRDDDMMTKFNCWINASSSTFIQRVQKEAETDGIFYAVYVKVLEDKIADLTNPEAASSEVDLDSIGVTVKEYIGFNIVAMINQHTAPTYFDLLSKAPETITY